MQYRAFLLAVVLIQGAWGQVAKETDTIVAGRDALSHIDAFSVLIEQLDDNAKSLGFTEGRIRTAVELRLRSLGFQIKDEGVFGSYLYVHISVLCKGADGQCAASAKIEMMEMVRLRNNKLTRATIWDAEDLAISGRGQMREKLVPDLLMELVDKFANDYLAVHPKR